MMKITTHNDNEGTTLELEGSLSGEWVKEVLDCWDRATLMGKQKHIRIDLTGTTFIDGAGKRLLAMIYRAGAEFIAVDPMTKAIVEEISRCELTEQTF